MDTIPLEHHARTRRLVTNERIPNFGLGGAIIRGVNAETLLVSAPAFVRSRLIRRRFFIVNFFVASRSSKRKKRQAYRARARVPPPFLFPSFLSFFSFFLSTTIYFDFRPC